MSYYTIINMLLKAVEVLKGLEADKGANIEFSSLGLLQKRPGSQKVRKQARQGYLSGSLAPSTTEEKLQQITKKLEQQGIDCDFEIPLETGLPFKNYGQFDNVFDEGKTVLAHKEGEVLLVDVWATWCGPCQRPMAHNQQMLVKNDERWKNKVRIVGVSVDDSKETIKNRVEQKGWTKIEHLTLLGWKGENQLIKDYKIQGIPFICLVDKFGKTNYIGHPSQIDLERRINELIIQESEAKPEAKVSASQNKYSSQNEDFNKLIQSFSQETVADIFKDVELFCFKYEINNRYQQENYSSTLKIKAHVLEGDQNGKKKAKEFFGEAPNLQLSIQEVKFIDIPVVEKPACWKCLSSLEYPFYWLKWEEGNKFGCRKCVQEKSTQEGRHYVYEKNSILLVGKWKKVSAKKLGQNVQPEDPSKVQDANQFLCNCCSKCPTTVGQPRYVCLGCRPDPNFKGDHDDVCSNCIESLIKGDEKALQGLAEDGHDKNHPLLRILYHVKGYYDY